MKRILFLLFSLLGVSGILRSEDDFVLFQRQFKDVSTEWRHYTSPERRSLARSTLDPRARKALRFQRELLDAFLATSRCVQKGLKQLKMDNDLSPARHAEYLRGLVLLYVRGIENDMSSVTNDSGALDQAFRLMEADMESLREIGFSCEDGVAALSAEAQAWPELYRYKRQFRMMKLFLDERAKPARTEMALSKNAFDNEFSTISDAADRLAEKVMRTFPELREECVLLPVMTRKQLEEIHLFSSSPKVKGVFPSENGSRKPGGWIQQINALSRKIEDRIRADQREKERAQAAAERGKKDKTPDPPQPERTARSGQTHDDPPKKEKRIPVERWSEDALNEELVRLRQQILPDAGKNSLSADELDQCLGLLSDRERRQYETIRLRQIRSGTGEQDAPLEALKELKEILAAPGAVLPSKQDKIRILKKVLPEADE